MMVRIPWTLSKKLDSNRTHLGDFPLEVDKVLLLNSSGHDPFVHRAIRCIVIKFRQFIPLIDNIIVQGTCLTVTFVILTFGGGMGAWRRNIDLLSPEITLVTSNRMPL